MDRVVQLMPSLVLRENDRVVTTMLKLLSHLDQGENGRYLNVDWIAMFNVQPRMFNFTPKGFGARMKFVDRLYREAFGVKDYAAHLLLE